jgi:hypothetical protein
MFPLLLAALLCLQTPPPAVDFNFAKPRFVASGWPDASRIAFIFDVDGDGLGDLCSISLEGRGNIEFARNVRNGKFGSGAIGVAIPEPLTLGDLAEIVRCREEAIPASQPAEPQTKTTRGGRQNLLFRRAGGETYRIASDGKEGFTLELHESASSAPASRPAAAGVVVWRREGGVLPGDFDGDGHADEIKDNRVYFTRRSVPPASVTFLRDLPPNAKVTYGDFDGDGKDDILVLRYDSAWRLGRDLQLYICYSSTDTDFDRDGLSNEREAQLKSDPLDADTDHDGLLDGWEVLGEGGIDLPALGASPTHKDCVVYLQRYDNTQGASVRKDIDRAVEYWSKLAVKNPDGAPGIHLITIWLGPLSSAGGGKPWWELGDQNLPREARGLAHYMNIGPGGGGQSSELGDMGGAGEGALYATFLHEFGHQVGLSHAGGPLPEMCPTYSSLMNYGYSYAFNDDYNQIHYSSGDLASLVLNEVKLSERVAIPYDKLKFLEKGPWRLKLKSDGNGTWIDWNRNGHFEEGVVRADITDTYGVGVGPQNTFGKTVFAPALATHADKLFLFGVNRERKLFIRTLAEEGKASDEVFLSQVQPEGDPWATSDGESIYLFVPAKDGVACLSARDDAALPKAPVRTIPDSAGCQVSAVIYKKQVVCILWRGPDQPLRFTTAGADGSFATPRDLGGLMSHVCPGATENPSTGELCVGTTVVTKKDNQEKRSWRVTALNRNDSGEFVVANTRTVGGNAGWVGNSRPVLLFESGTDLGPAGRLHFLGVGWTDPPNHNGCFYGAMTIGDMAQDEGWRLRRYVNEWTTTRSPIAACWFRNDIALAYRWFGNVHGDDDDNLNICYHALGIFDEELRDYDDVLEISEVGLAHSIAWRLGSIK